eukprot:1086143_1
MVEYLIASGAIPSALICASTLGYKDIVEVLVQNGEDVNVLNIKNQSALDLARINGHDDVSGYLEANGAKTGEVITKEANDCAFALMWCMVVFVFVFIAIVIGIS